MPPVLYLASGSPRRAELLRKAGLSFELLVPDVDEDLGEGLPPKELVREVAHRKAAAAIARARGNAWLVAADTTVEAPDGANLGKPRDATEAKAFLRKLSGATHRVWTAVVVVRHSDEARFETVEVAHVTFQKLSDAMIDAYVATGEPLDKAGAYGFQSVGDGFIAGIQGDPTTVVGLPVDATLRLLREAGFPLAH
ncbi:MAG: Maf family protein [Methanobacteriota archaeon]